jgi:RNA polymerase sigma-70 factor (ECF subfamily)
MISDNAFAQEVREVTDTAFAVSYLILGNSTDCEDAVGQAVLQAYESRGKLRKRESFRAWFLKILRNEAYGILRRQRRVQPMDELPEQSAPQEDTDERLDLQSAMMELDADQRTALLLQQEGYSMEEIAQTLDAPVGTVKSRIYRAKSTLRTILQEN